MIKDRLGCKPLPLQLPIGSEADLKGVVDLVKMKGVVWQNEDLGAKFDYVDIPEDLIEKAKQYRQNLVETAVAWKEALSRTDGPTSIILSRQNLDSFVVKELDQLKMGGYFVSKKNDATVNLIATGSEVSLALEAEKLLTTDGINCNVVSVPCLETLLSNKDRYNEIFSAKTTNIVIECGHPNSWYKHTENVVGIDCFGESGEGKDLMDHFGFTPEKITKKIKQMI